MGSAVVAAAYLLVSAGGVHVGSLAWLLVVCGVFAAGLFTSEALEKEWGEDPGPVVIDEALGYLVTVAWLPQSLWLGVAGFFLFRVLDIVKPPPARQSEKLPGGWGIMVDDLVAGIFGNLLIRAVLYAMA